MGDTSSKRDDEEPVLIRRSRGKKMHRNRMKPLKASSGSTDDIYQDDDDDEEPVLIKRSRGKKMHPSRNMNRMKPLKASSGSTKKDDDDHVNMYMSLEEVEKRSNMFRTEQREKYRNYLIFLFLVLPERLASKTVVEIFSFEKREFARAISVLTSSGIYMFERRHDDKTEKPPHGYTLTYFNNYHDADTRYRNFQRQNMTMSRCPEYEYKMHTYVVDVVPFNTKVGIRLCDPFNGGVICEVDGEEEVDNISRKPTWSKKPYNQLPWLFETRHFLTIQRVAARVHKDGGSNPPTPEEIKKKNERGVLDFFW